MSLRVDATVSNTKGPSKKTVQIHMNFGYFRDYGHMIEVFQVCI